MPRWCNHGVIGAVEWPRREVEFQFGAYNILACPATKDWNASLHMDLDKYGLDSMQSMSVFNQILSLATWFDDQPAILLDGSSGSARPVKIERREDGYLTSILDSWIFSRDPIADERARRALAIFREARNLERYHSMPFAALGYYKLIELKFPEGKGAAGREQWIVNAISRLMSKGNSRGGTGRADRPWWATLPKFDSIVGSNAEEIAKFFWMEGRQAVAHAKYAPSINPDEVSDQRRLSYGLPIFREVAREFIRSEMNVSSDRWA